MNDWPEHLPALESVWFELRTWGLRTVQVLCITGLVTMGPALAHTSTADLPVPLWNDWFSQDTWGGFDAGGGQAGGF